MNIDELVQFVNEQSIRGDIAREFMGIVSDYQSGSITVEDKEALVKEVLANMEAQGLAQDEIMMRWAVSVATVIASVV